MTYTHSSALDAVACRDRVRQVQLDRLCRTATDAVWRATERGHTLPVAVRRGLVTVFDGLLGVSVDSRDLVADIAYWRHRLSAELDGTGTGESR